MTQPAPSAPGSSPHSPIVVGAGPAGVFTALSFAENNPHSRIVLIDQETEPLAAFNRPNRFPWSLTRALWEPEAMASQCIHGAREMLGPLTRWGAADTLSWFEERGHPLTAHDDGSCTPPVDIAATRDFFLQQLRRHPQIQLITNTRVIAADSKSTGGFWLTFDNADTLQCSHLVLTTGGLLASRSKSICAAFGHTIVEPVPSIFDLHTRDDRILKAHGESVPCVRINDDSGAEACGSVNLEPWGLGGPAIGQLTAKAAESMRNRAYNFTLRIDWIGAHPRPDLLDIPAIMRTHPRRPAGDTDNAPLPRRLWLRFLEHAGISPETPWQRLSKPQTRALQRQLRHDRVKIIKRGAHQQETTTGGGVALDEIDFRTLGSRLVPGLHFAGEILDIDALPGGANLQIAWTTAHLASQAITPQESRQK